MLDAVWQRRGMSVPIYYSGVRAASKRARVRTAQSIARASAAGLAERASFFYKIFVDWTNERIKSALAGGVGSGGAASTNPFEFKRVQPFVPGAESAGPCVLFASPGV